MKLRQIKLAGFKTFVDPTKVILDGQLTGIVGPNGCGKSNIMESVKWVMGSSSAKELRSESMEAVIFSGTDTRQAISRASVELIFDNSEGSAPAEWSQYSEISVKRIIEKEKGSSYLINNSIVRRKDVADLFLGTGLGSKGYAIIGQNTISQIVEAKPEELKSFLEEAAGVSKYKERRKETEYRLRDTKENLARVQDLLQEINQQITKLESQAETANKYNKQQESLKFHQAQIWALKKRIANESWDVIKDKIETQTIELDQFTAHLREIESKVEFSRQEHAEASDEININQAKFYEVNAAVSKTENALTNIKNDIERLTVTEFEARQKIENHTTLESELSDAIEKNQNSLKSEASKLESHEQVGASNKSKLVEAEEAYRASLSDFEATQASLQLILEEINLESTRIDFINQSIHDLNQRKNLMAEELGQLMTDSPDSNHFPQQATEINKQLEISDKLIKEKKTEAKQVENKVGQIRLERDNKAKQLHETEIRISSLLEFLNKDKESDEVSSWLNAVGISNHQTIIDKVSIKKGWENALGYFLSDQIQAYGHSELNLNQINARPPTSITLIGQAGSVGSFVTNNKLISAATVISSKETHINHALSEWLCHVYLTDESTVKKDRENIKYGEILIAKNGDIFGKSYQIIHAKEGDASNALARNKQLEELKNNLPSMQLAYKTSATNLKTIEEKNSLLVTEIEKLLTENNQLIDKKNALNLELNKQQQVVLMNEQRSQVLKKEINNCNDRIMQLSHELKTKQTNITQHQDEKEKLNQSKLTSEHKKELLEKAFNDERHKLFELDKLKQEFQFNIRLLKGKYEDLVEKRQNAILEKHHLDELIKKTQSQLQENNIDNLEAQLKINIQNKERVRADLVTAREKAEKKETHLNEMENKRLEKQHSLNPLTEKLQETKIEEREAQVIFEQSCNELSKTSYDELELLDQLRVDVNVVDLETKCYTISEKINRLGPVNLAAIQELEAIQERKVYLQKQIDDLKDASNTLRQAIKKIDIETREKLDKTYKTVNKNFNDYFKVLFDGGRAELQLLGEEILDTGLQVLAQPPGKKNTTIHLLSSGEKALTAIALVFALFKLNPAPFCLMDEVDAPLDDTNTERFCNLVKEMSAQTQFLFVTHNKYTMEIAEQLVGVTMQEPGVSRIVEVNLQTVEKIELVG